MPSSWVRKTLALVFLTAVVTGCGSGGGQEPPAPLPEEDTPQATTQPIEQTVPIQRSGFNEADQPIDPATGQPLQLVFYFEFDKAVLKPQSLAVLELHAKALRGNSDRRVMIAGHCDERGTREYNLALGERRSDAVRTFLISSGVTRGQIDTVSYGEERPIDPGHTEAAWAKNRRAELSYR